MREVFTEELLNNLVEAIHLYTGDDKDKISEYVKEDIKSRIQPCTISNVLRHKGDLVEKETPLLNFVKMTQEKDYIMSPAGSLYKKPSVERNQISGYMGFLKAERSAAKKCMFAAKRAGNSILAENENFRQANAKISANALSGIMKSAYNLFYDVGNYNSITSIGRTIVTMSATMIEQYCGGNFCFFDFNELINHIVLCKRNIVSETQLQECMDKYKLIVPTKETLTKFLFASIEKYNSTLTKDELYTKVEVLVSKLTQSEVTYIYYYNNLKHIFMDNEKSFKPFIKSMFKDIEGDSSTDVSELKNINHELLSVITTCNNHLIAGKKMDDIGEKHPEVAQKLIAIGKHYQSHVDRLQSLFDVFINNAFIPPALNNKKDMLRSCILLLDTDSNIFTLIHWVKWYTQDEFSDRIENYQISSFVVYLITKLIERILNVFADKLGVEDEDVGKLSMKNEFLFPVLILLDIKKNYIALRSVQEGMVLKKPELEIKGGTLRGSSVCKESQDWFKELVWYILTTGQKEQLDASILIKKVVDFENKVRDSVYRGETTYLKYSSVEVREKYKKPEGAIFITAEAWNVIYGDIYDKIALPTKCNILNLHQPSASFMKDLELENSTVHRNFLEFRKIYGKYTNAIAMHPLTSSIPKELFPLIDIRPIIYHNAAPAYRILKNIGLGVGYKEPDELLYSDIYKF